jgi:hypothetical protein
LQGVAPTVSDGIDEEQPAARLVVNVRMAERRQSRRFLVHDPDTYPCRARQPEDDADLGARGVPGGVGDQFCNDQRGSVGEIVEVPYTEDVSDELATDLSR